MGTINLTPIGPNGTPNDSGPVDSNFDTIQSVINGNLDSANISSLDLARITQSGANLNDVATWGGGSWLPQPSQSELPIDMSDITQSGATEADIVRWRGAGPAWTPEALSVLLSELAQSGATAGQVPTWVGPDWQAQDVPAELPPATSDGDVLTLVGGVPAWVTPTSPDVVLIERISPGGNSNSMEFTVPNGFAALKMVCRVRSTAGAAFSDVWVRINGVATGSYWSQFVLGAGATPAAGEHIGVTQWVIGTVPAATSVGSVWGQVDVTFAEPEGSARKSFTSLCMLEVNTTSTNTQVRAHSGWWNNTAEIDTLSVLPGGGAQWLAGSAISLYGYRS